MVYTPENPHSGPAASTGGSSSESVTSSDGSEDDATVQQVEHTATSFYEAFVSRSQGQCWAELMAPQRSEAWLQARAHAITASNFGAAAGHNSYCSPEQCLVDKLWSTFKGNEFTIYGTFHEPDARSTMETLLNGPLQTTLQALAGNPNGGPPSDASSPVIGHHLFETGLLKDHRQPWMAVSPDGLLRIDRASGAPAWALVEYKCPARLRDTDGHPYGRYDNNVPPYYMDQVQGIMGLLNKYPELLTAAEASVGLPSAGGQKGLPYAGPQAAFFVVWQPHQIHVTLVPYDAAYYTTELEPALEAWYFKKYLPLAALKHNGVLVEGSTTASPVIEVAPEKPLPPA